jgi:predicted amidophosphoribosyltransferase
MPRRNRNANTTLVSRDLLADQITRLAHELTAPVLCAGCQSNQATEGDYCALCKGLIIFAARRTVLGRR